MADIIDDGASIPTDLFLYYFKKTHIARPRRCPMSEVSEAEYKGKPMLVIKNTPDDKFPFQFGLKKAKLVLAHIEDIKKFVETHDK
jgi:hypothetical protein